jgi:hypothetical protein
MRIVQAHELPQLQKQEEAEGSLGIEKALPVVW